MKKLCPLILLAFFAYCHETTAQVLDPFFNPELASSQATWSGVEQSDGKIIVTNDRPLLVNGQPRFIFRMNTDGTLDNTFDVDTDGGLVYDVGVQSSGKIIIGGGFTKVNGTNIDYFARLNSDGSLDGSFNPGSGPDAMVTKVIVQPNDKILIVGSFNNFNGTMANYFTRTNANGSLNGSFNSNLGTGFSFTPQDCDLSPDGSIVFVTSFFNGGGINGILKLNSNG
ncbi:MAG: delta-60 repeat domain-containing protein, partial [Bacteroidetes bacterium]|nr:delta-60 repeat domain-containing protein [Bacteroidota bacterium]